MSIAPSIGFTASSAPGSSSPSSYVVALLAGVTTYSNTLYQGSASYSPLLSNSTSIPTPSSSSSNISSSSRSSLHTTSSLLLSSGAFVILSSSGSSHLVIYNSLPDLSQLPTSALGSGSGGMVVSIAQSTSCIGGCSSGGFCAAEGKCICSSGFAGNTCSASILPLSLSRLAAVFRFLSVLIWELHHRCMLAGSLWSIMSPLRIVK